jgi:DNA-binding NtrC family response regulator
VRGGVTVLDLGSSNGTYLDRRRLGRQPTFARIGSVIRAGDSLLLVASLPLEDSPASAGPLVGGAALAPVRRQISLVARTPLTVLVSGETGTGKEIVASQLHATSGRSGELIAVNCAALAEGTIDAELFGHVRGAFTGAHSARKGLIAAAHAGTLFLDEVGELTPAAQAKLLRVLEERAVRPVGSEVSQPVDLRVVCATHRDLRAAADQGTFRADLMARLTTVEIHLPALRERLEDLPALIEHLLRRAGRPGTDLTTDALEALAVYRWPQNVRELDNVLRGSALMGNPKIELGDLPGRITASSALDRAPSPSSATMVPIHAREDLRAQLEEALIRARGNIRQAAIDIGISRARVYRLLREWQLNVDQFRTVPGTSLAGKDEAP